MSYNNNEEFQIKYMEYKYCIRHLQKTCNYSVTFNYILKRCANYNPIKKNDNNISYDYSM